MKKLKESYSNTGKLIAEARKEAGFTQKELSEKLNISDKAVSKWERGISLPDQLLLPKLSMLLDVDIELLIPNQLFTPANNWSGLIITNEIEANTMIYDKPLIEYLLSYFLLVGITNIKIDGCSNSYVDNLNIEKYGFKIENNNQNKMVIYKPFLLFGSNITRIFRAFMNENENIGITIDKKEIPLLFTHNYDSIEKVKNSTIKKELPRGLVYIPLSKENQIKDASEFVEIYQRNSGNKISDLKEIARKRNIIL